MRILDFCCSLSKAEFDAEAEKINENEKPPSEHQRWWIKELDEIKRRRERLRQLIFGDIYESLWYDYFGEQSDAEAEKINENEKPPSVCGFSSLERLRQLLVCGFSSFAIACQLIRANAEKTKVCGFSSFRANAEKTKVCGFSSFESEAEEIKAFPYSFPNQKPGKFPVNRGKDHLGEIGEEPVNKGGKDHLGELGEEPVNKGGKDHLGELGEEPVNKGGKDPGHDGWDFVLDAGAQIMRMTALAA